VVGGGFGAVVIFLWALVAGLGVGVGGFEMLEVRWRILVVDEGSVRSRL